MSQKKKVHLLGIGGSAMSNLAAMFAEQGWQVSGSDENVYPPASDTLDAFDIKYFQGYDKSHITEDFDLVVVGNVISRANVEAQSVLDMGLAYTSMSGALFEYFMKDKKRIAVCGTHGKTTTTSLLAWVYECAQTLPSYFVGGIPQNFHQGFQLEKGPYFIIEGDEYDTAYFEKTPKFLHYYPQHVILTSIEFDHADIYEDFDQIYAQFEKLVQQIGPKGTLVACKGSDSVARLVQDRKDTITYGEKDATWTFAHQKDQPFGQSFDVFYEGQFKINVETHLLGQHNRFNILAVIAQAYIHGLDLLSVKQAIKSFTGVKKRQERIGESNAIAVYEDFAHHPSAIKTTIEGFLPMCRARKGRLIVAIEPRSNTMRRNIFQNILPDCLDKADMVLLTEPFVKKDNLDKQQMLNTQKVIDDLQQRGVKASCHLQTDVLLDELMDQVKPNDVVVFMSNGDFQNAARRFISRV